MGNLGLESNAKKHESLKEHSFLWVWVEIYCGYINICSAGWEEPWKVSISGEIFPYFISSYTFFRNVFKHHFILIILFELKKLYKIVHSSLNTSPDVFFIPYQQISYILTFIKKMFSGCTVKHTESYFLNQRLNPCPIGSMKS